MISLVIRKACVCVCVCILLKCKGLYLSICDVQHFVSTMIKLFLNKVIIINVGMC